MNQMFEPSARYSFRPLNDTETPVDLSALAASMRTWSSFRFAYQWFAAYSLPASVVGAGKLLGTVVATPHLHEFLRTSFVAEYDDAFEIGPIHQHARITSSNDAFPAFIAQTAIYNLGDNAPRECRTPTLGEVEEVRSLFATAGAFEAFELLPPEVELCDECGPSAHLFSTWFCGVYDWCFCLVWKHQNLAWVGCVTDTD